MRQEHSPLNPLPWIIWVLALPLIAMELVISLGAAGIANGPGGADWRIQALERFAVFPQIIRAGWERGQLIPPEPWRLVSYVTVHGSLTNTLFAVVILLALGKFAAEIFRWWAIVVIWLASSIAGAVIYTLVLPPDAPPLFGAFPPDYGLIGAFTFLLWMRLQGTGHNRYRAFALVGILLAAQVLFAFVFGGGHGWVADFAGFATGFLLSFVLIPGGLRQVVARLRQR